MAISMLDCDTALLIPLLLGPSLSCCNMSIYPSLFCGVFGLVWFFHYFFPTGIALGSLDITHCCLIPLADSP